MALSATFVQQIKHSGKSTGDKHSDGQGMYLLVKQVGKYWRMDYTIYSKRKTLALGVYPAVSLAEARVGRTNARALIAKGLDPSRAKRDAREQQAHSAANTYESVAREFHKIKQTGWSSGHGSKWLRLNELYMFPVIGHLPLATIKTSTVLNALRKVEGKGILSTAQDLQQMAGQIFRYAVQTDRVEVNPIVDLKGALKPHVAKHFAATLEPEKVGQLLRAIDGYSGQATTRAALKLSSLFFQRPGNVRAMEWTWVDFESAMLTIPPKMMKRTLHQKINGKPHFVPLAKQALVLLKELQRLTGGGIYVFPSSRSSMRPMSDGTINAALRRLDFGSDDHVAHGFRAMARTMIAERMKGIPGEIVEAQLAHGKNGPLGSAYDRAEYMDQRRNLMQRWADYLDKLRLGAKVISLKAA